MGILNALSAIPSWQAAVTRYDEIHSMWLKWDEERQEERVWCGDCKKFLEWEDEQHDYPMKDDEDD